MPPKKPIRRPQPPKPAGQASAGASDSQNEPSVKPDPEPAPAPAEPTQPNTGSQPVSIASTPAAASPAPPNGTPGPPRPPALSRTPSTRGGRGTPRIAAPKFAGRRSQAQRAEAEKAEAERQRLEAERKAKEDARRARQQGRGRGRGDGAQHRGRGRGGYIGQTERQPPVASGPFSAGQVSSDAGASRRFGGGRSGGGGGEGTTFGGPMTGFSGGGRSGGGGGTYVKREGGGGDFTTVSQAIKTEDGGYISSDEEEETDQRLNVDELRVVDLTADDGPPEQGSMVPPVRVKREAHKERTVGVNADAATAQEGVGKDPDQSVSERRRGKQRARDVEITGQSDSFQAAYSSDEQEPAIKAEPVDDEGGVGDAEPVAENEAAPQPLSPESKRRKERTKSRTFSSSALERPIYQTQDELEEWERHQADLRLLHSELGNLVLPSSTDKDGDANMEAADQQPVDRKADKVYLFQFPPVLPDLLPIQVKPDPDAPPADGDVMQVDGQPNTAADPVKVEDGPAQTKLPSGAVGKMRVHKSGKVTLDWGGTSLLVGMGGEAGFLQDVLVAALPDQKGAGGGEDDQLPGVAMSMGQVKGKFVVTPDWERILAY